MYSFLLLVVFGVETGMMKQDLSKLVDSDFLKCRRILTARYRPLQTLLPPLAPGQWTNFSRVYEQTFANWYAIFVIMLHIARPVRVSLALAVSGYWDTMVYSMKERLKVNHVAAVALVAMFVDILGSCVLLAAGVTFASLFSGVPFWR